MTHHTLSQKTLDHWRPHQQCNGWTCTACGHHSISAVGPVPSCAKCREPNPARVTAEKVRLNRKRKADLLYAELLEETQNTLSETQGNLRAAHEEQTC